MDFRFSFTYWVRIVLLSAVMFVCMCLNGNNERFASLSHFASMIYSDSVRIYDGGVTVLRSMA